MCDRGGVEEVWKINSWAFNIQKLQQRQSHQNFVYSPFQAFCGFFPIQS